MRLLTADVLVLGSGLAGLRAALACRNEGLDVLVCSKASPGLGNCTAVSQGAFSNSLESFSVDAHRESTLAAGHRLNDMAKVNILVERAGDAVRQLETFGVSLKKRPRGFKSISRGLGREGVSITRPIVQYARDQGVRFLSPFFAWDFLVSQGEVLGAWGFLKDEKEPTLLEAKAVILAAGGAGALYSRTDNPPGITGDGYAMGYRAGLPLTDMEFVQFYPLGTALKDRPGRFIPSAAAEVGDLVNSRGENLAEKYAIKKRPLAVASRDFLSRAMALEVFHGNGIDGAVRLNMGDWESRWETAVALTGRAEQKNWFRKLLDGKDFLLVMPVCHFFMGGMTTEGLFRTNLKGLFAAGEVVGGLHGANRLGGNALSETVVFGEAAGREAAAHAKGRSGASGNSLKKMVEESSRNLFAESRMGEAHDGKVLRRKVRELMWEYAGLIRSEEGLQKAGEELKSCQNLKVDQVRTKSLTGFLELKNMLLVAEMVVEAAQMRRESRGSHYRMDFPNADEGWIKHIEIRRDQDEMKLRTAKVDSIDG